MSISECCVTGFAWEGSPAGRVGRLAELDTYISGHNPTVAILFVHDLFGWKFNNLRLLADHYAQEINATVFVPDFFGGQEVSHEALFEGRLDAIDLFKFSKDNSRDVREPEIVRFAQALRSEYVRISAVGFCYGGWACFRLGSKEYAREDGQLLVDCISVGHPTWLKKEDINDIAVPVQILAPELDPMYTEDLKAHTLETLPKSGLPWDYQYFPRIEHGALTRGNAVKAGEREAMARAKNAVVSWMKIFASE